MSPNRPITDQLITTKNARFIGRFSADFLDSMMHVGDPLADAAVAVLADASYGTNQSQHQRLVARRRDGCEVADRFLTHCEERPSWVNDDAIAQGQRLASSHLALVGLSLMHSLFAGGVFTRAAYVTSSTGRLGSDQTRRMRETSAYYTSLLEPGSLNQGGTGFESTIKVRLLHGSIRRWLPEKSPEPYVGVPVDQTMLAMTNALFSYLNMRSLRRMGATVTTDDEVAHHHLWRYVGHLLGIDAKLLTDTPQDEAELWSSLVAHQAMPETIGPEVLDAGAVAIAGAAIGQAKVSRHHRALGQRAARAMLLHLSGPDWFAVDEPMPTLPTRSVLRLLGTGPSLARHVPGMEGLLIAFGRKHAKQRLAAVQGHNYDMTMPDQTEEQIAQAEQALANMSADIHARFGQRQSGTDTCPASAARPVSVGVKDRVSMRGSRVLAKHPLLGDAVLRFSDWGNLLHQDVRIEPYPAYERMRRDGNIAWSTQYQQWFVTGHEEAKALLASSNLTSASQPRLLMQVAPHKGLSPRVKELASHFLLFIDQPDHTRLRKLVSAAFTNRQIARLEEATIARAERLLDQLPTYDAPDLFDHYNRVLPIEVIADMLGLDDQPFTEELSAALTLYLNPIPTEYDFDWVNLTLAAGIDYFEDLIERRRADPQDDLISALVHVTSENEERFTSLEIVALAMFLMFAGHETTSGALGTAQLALQAFPDQRAKLLATSASDGPSLWNDAVNELFRFDSPLQIDPRTANCDFLFGDKTIRRGQNVLMILGAANRDPEVFSDPATLDLSRANSAKHLAFGFGAHHCLGASLARMELRVGLSALYERFPDVTIDPDAVEWKSHPVLRGPIALPVASFGR